MDLKINAFIHSFTHFLFLTQRTNKAQTTNKQHPKNKVNILCLGVCLVLEQGWRNNGSSQQVISREEDEKKSLPAHRK